MKLVRKGVFETNSSSTHSITMCVESDYEKWKNGELFYCINDNKFYTLEEKNEIIKKLVIQSDFKYNWDNHTITYHGIEYDYDDKELIYSEHIDEITEEMTKEYLDKYYDTWAVPCTMEEYDDIIDFETYKEDFVTKSGEKIIAFGYYGTDY